MYLCFSNFIQNLVQFLLRFEYNFSSGSIPISVQTPVQFLFIFQSNFSTQSSPIFPEILVQFLHRFDFNCLSFSSTIFLHIRVQFLLRLYSNFPAKSSLFKFQYNLSSRFQYITISTKTPTMIQTSQSCLHIK